MLRSKLNILLSVFLVFNFIQYIEAADTKKSSLDLNKCPTCEVINYCFGLHKTINKFAIYPPDNVKENYAVGQCYCYPDNVDRYIECVRCHFTNVAIDKKGSTPEESTIRGVCTKMINSGPPNTKQTQDTKNTAKNVQNDTTSQVPGTQGNSTMTGTPSGNSTTTVKASNTPGRINQGNNDASKGNANEKSNNKSKIIMFSVIGAVVVVAVIGFFVYNNKKKSRPESMPFFGNTATSPRPYATLDLPKDTNSSLQYGGSSNTLGYSSTSPLNYEYNPPQTQYDTQYGQYGSEYQQFENTSTNLGGATTALATSTAVAAVSADNSVSYDPRRESMNQSANLSMNEASGPYYTCTYPYEPKLDDELELRLNDEIQVIEEFEDGWMKAYNKTTMREGMAPIVCIKPSN